MSQTNAERIRLPLGLVAIYLPQRAEANVKETAHERWRRPSFPPAEERPASVQHTPKSSDDQRDAP